MCEEDAIEDATEDPSLPRAELPSIMDAGSWTNRELLTDHALLGFGLDLRNKDDAKAFRELLSAIAVNMQQLGFDFAAGSTPEVEVGEILFGLYRLKSIPASTPEWSLSLSSLRVLIRNWKDWMGVEIDENKKGQGGKRVESRRPIPQGKKGAAIYTRQHQGIARRPVNKPPSDVARRKSKWEDTPPTRRASSLPGRHREMVERWHSLAPTELPPYLVTRSGACQLSPMVVTPSSSRHAREAFGRRGQDSTDPTNPLTRLVRAAPQADALALAADLQASGEIQLGFIWSSIFHETVQPTANALVQRIFETWLESHERPSVGERALRELTILDLPPEKYPEAMLPSPYTINMIQFAHYIREQLGESRFSTLKMLDLGSGRGPLGVALCKLGATNVSASDVNLECVEATKASFMANGFPDVDVRTSDMMGAWKVQGTENPEQFDLIFFNCPQLRSLSRPLYPVTSDTEKRSYIGPRTQARQSQLHRMPKAYKADARITPLPRERGDAGIYDAGVNGRDFIERALLEVKPHLRPAGCLAMTISSMSNINKVAALADTNGYEMHVVSITGVTLRDSMYHIASGVAEHTQVPSYADYLREEGRKDIDPNEPNQIPLFGIKDQSTATEYLFNVFFQLKT